MEIIRKNKPHIYSKVLVGVEDEENIKTVVKHLNNGKVIAFYAATSYALGVNAYNLNGINRIYDIKRRERNKPLSILANKDQFERWALVEPHVRDQLSQIVEKYWPGSVSIVLPKLERNGETVIPSEVTRSISSVHLVCMDKTTELLTLYSEAPIAATSANISGEELITDPVTLIEKFGNVVDLLLVGPESNYKHSTTIIDFTCNPPKILRESSNKLTLELLEIVPDLAV